MFYHLIKIILDFISSIFWPLAILIIFFILKDELKLLITNLRRFNISGIGLEMNQSEQEIINETPNKFGYKFIESLKPPTRELFEKIIFNESAIVKRENDNLYDYSLSLLMTKIFNETYLLIYGSQIRLLLGLNNKIKEKKNILKLKYYDPAKLNHPNVYLNYSFEDWLSFLINKQLVVIEEDNILITFYAQDFIKFLTEFQYDLERPY